MASSPGACGRCQVATTAHLLTCVCPWDGAGPSFRDHIGSLGAGMPRLGKGDMVPVFSASWKAEGTRSKEVMACASSGSLGRGFMCVSYLSHKCLSFTVSIHVLCVS